MMMTNDVGEQLRRHRRARRTRRVIQVFVVYAVLVWIANAVLGAAHVDEWLALMAHAALLLAFILVALNWSRSA